LTLRPTAASSLKLDARRALTLAIGCVGLLWGGVILPKSEAVDEFWLIESQLLRFETFSKLDLAQILDSVASENSSVCDTHSQRAMLLMELPLADAALRSGVSDEFDRRIEWLEKRSRLTLGCAPRDSFVWLLAFSLEVLHGQLNEHAFDLLAMSYQTSPNEAWISVRRVVVAMPLVLIAPEPLRQKILGEFRQLIRYGFVDVAARSYAASSKATQSLLQTQLEQLDLNQQKIFSNSLQRIRS
jgi:hypothetical protein